MARWMEGDRDVPADPPAELAAVARCKFSRGLQNPPTTFPPPPTNRLPPGCTRVEKSSGHHPQAREDAPSRHCIVGPGYAERISPPDRAEPARTSALSSC